MAARWKPGDVFLARVDRWEAVAEWPDDTSRVLLRVKADGYLQAVKGDPSAPFSIPSSCQGFVRPLAVLDPDSTEDAGRLVRLYEKAKEDHPVTRVFSMQQALRAYASPEPEIEEPANWLAVVVDIDGVQWYRWSIRPKDHDRAWLSVWDEGRCYPTAWSALRPSRVLSPGVEES